MDRFNSLHPMNYENFKKEIDKHKENIRKKYSNTFWVERYQPHITFLYYGKIPYKEKMKLLEECHIKFEKIPDELKILKLGKVKILRGSRADFVVIDIIVDKSIKNLRKELYDKYNIKDKIQDYQPHITLGKIKTYDDFEEYYAYGVYSFTIK